MKKVLVIIWLSTLGIGLFALTGYSVSNEFQITEETLPVELSSFTATATSENQVRLQWTSQSETSLAGYYVYRAQAAELWNAGIISALIPAANSSSQQSYVYDDHEVIPHGSYYYWLHGLELDGSGQFYGPIAVNVNHNDEGGSVPQPDLSTGIKSIYPNPFNPHSTIGYYVCDATEANIRIYNTKGQLLREYERSHSRAGAFEILFDGKDANGKDLGSGLYLVLMQSGKQVFSRKMALVK